MLKPHFREGTALATNKSVEISLPDDDGETMLALCRCMHAQTYSSIPDLRELYQICDKYDVVAYMAPMAQFWLRSRIHEPQKVLANKLLHGFLDIAIGFRAKHLAGKIARGLITDSSESLDEFDASDGIVFLELFCMYIAVIGKSMF